MRSSDDKKRNHHGLLLWLFLGLLCIGAAELIACRHFAPAVYERVTAPVRAAVQTVSARGKAAVQTVADHGKAAAERLSSQLEAMAEQREAEKREQETDETDIEISQEAGGPALVNDAPLLDPSITELTVSDGQSVLTGGVIPIVYFNQGDEAWSTQLYGTDDIGRYGCGPTAMAMAVRSFTGEETDPAQMAKLAVSGGYWARHGGSYLSIVNGLAKKCGLTSASVELTTEAVENALLSGKILVALMGPGHFTTSGHFILIRGITLEGTLLVADPNSQERSLQEWETQLILDELSHSTAHGAPLWSLEYFAP